MISDDICGNCFFVETSPTGECDCIIDDIFKRVGYWDSAKDCFESRTGMFDNEEMNYD